MMNRATQLFATGRPAFGAARAPRTADGMSSIASAAALSLRRG